MGDGPVRLYHGRYTESVLSDQEEAEGRCQTGITLVKAFQEQSCSVPHDSSSVHHPINLTASAY